MSYNPNTQLLHLCSLAATGGLSYGAVKPWAKPGSAEYVGSTWTFGGTRPGVFAAIDVRSGKIVWEKHWPELCYSGSATTAGNLVFVGRNSGAPFALDARTGRQLWSFQTGAGANNSATVFQHDGREQIAFYAGGSALAGSAHGDSLWLFSLDGKLGPVTAAKDGRAITHAGEVRPQAHTGSGAAAAGKAVFADNCSTCHGALGRGGTRRARSRVDPEREERRACDRASVERQRRHAALQDTLSKQQIENVAAYVTTKIAK